MTLKTIIFSVLIFGITYANTLAMQSSKNSSNMSDKDLLDLVEKGFIIREDCTQEKNLPCRSKEYYQYILLPKQQKIAAEFPNLPIDVTWTLAQQTETRCHRSQGRNMPRKLISSIDSRLFDDINNNSNK